MAEWWFELVGADYDLDFLSEHCGHLEWEIFKNPKDGKTCLRSEKLNSIQDDEMRLEEAKRMVRATAFAAYLHGEAIRDLKFNAMFNVESDGSIGSRTIFAEPITLPVRSRLIAKGSVGEEAQGPTSIELTAESLYRLNNPAIEKAVTLFVTYRDNWAQLSKIIEMVQKILGGDIPREWMSHNDIERLKRTANFPESAGDTARHVGTKGQPPRDPMSLKEARQKVGQVLCKCIERLDSTP